MSCVCRLRWIVKGGLACTRRRLAPHPPRRPATGSHARFMRAQIAVDVARGLAYMHAKKAGAIIHRDLKPGNLMVSGSMYHARCMPSHPINPTPASFRLRAPHAQALRSPVTQLNVKISGFTRRNPCADGHCRGIEQRPLAVSFAFARSRSPSRPTPVGWACLRVGMPYLAVMSTTGV